MKASHDDLSDIEVLNQTLFYNGVKYLSENIYYHMEDFHFDNTDSVDRMMSFLEGYGDVGPHLRVFLESNQFKELKEKLLLLSYKSLLEYWNQLQQLVESLRVSTSQTVSPRSLFNISKALVSSVLGLDI